MTTIKGFRGLSGSIGGLGGDQSDTDRPRLVVSGQSEDSQIVSVLKDTAPSGIDINTSNGQDSNLTIVDRYTLSAIDSTDSATTALTDLINQIKTLSEKIDASTDGTSQQSATSSEINALVTQYNSILNTDSRYSTSDLEAFRNQQSSLSSESLVTNASSLAVSTLETTAGGSITTISTAIAPELAAIAVFAASSSDLSGSVSGIQVIESALNASIIATDIALAAFSSDYGTYSTEIDSLFNVLNSLSSSSQDIGASSLTATTDLNAVIDSLSSISGTIPDSLTALSELSSASSSYAAVRTELTHATSSLSAEITDLSTAYGAAVVEAGSASSSHSLTSLQSDLRELSLDKGLKVDFSTTTLSAVTTEILDNHLSKLNHAATAEANSSAAITDAAFDGRNKPVVIDVNDLVPPIRKDSKAQDVAKVLSGAIKKNPDLALNAIGNFDAKVVLDLLKIE